jgi:hypothetical protein
MANELLMTVAAVVSAVWLIIATVRGARYPERCHGDK